VPLDDYMMPATDREYHAWRASHPSGSVLNIERTLNPNYMVLHTARCPHISTHSNAGAFTEHEYRKVCAATIDALREWVRRNGRPDGSFSHRCGTCGPV